MPLLKRFFRMHFTTIREVIRVDLVYFVECKFWRSTYQLLNESTRLKIQLTLSCLKITAVRSIIAIK